MIREVVQLGDPVLRQTARRVHRVDEPITRLIEDMIDTMHDAHGIGLAAPQIGVPLRVIVTNVDDELRVIVNPEISRLSDETEVAEEGCLSIRGYSGPVERSLHCQVRGLNEKGKKVKIKAEDWFARCLQHEIDHLNGILYIDRVEDTAAIHRVDEDFEVESDDDVRAHDEPDQLVAQADSDARPDDEADPVVVQIDADVEVVEAATSTA